VAVRVRERLDTDADLQMRRIGVSRRIVVASTKLIKTRGAPKQPQELTSLHCSLRERTSGTRCGGSPTDEDLSRAWNLNHDCHPATSEPCLTPPKKESERLLAGAGVSVGSRFRPADAGFARMERTRRRAAPRLHIPTKHAARRARGD